MSLTKVSAGVLNIDDLYGFRNRIINGDMRIDQRSAGASTTITATGYYSCDRWQTFASQASKFSIQQNAGSVTPPSGFTNYIGVTSLSDYTVLSTESFSIRQFVEGFNVSDLGWGTASAKTVTLSFWVRSSLTGTFAGAILWGSASANERSYPFTYSISVADTWEYKTVTIPGDTGTAASGLDTTTGRGISLRLSLGSTVTGTAGSWANQNVDSVTGAVSVVGTNGATWYITGVQLEVGSVATPFERRDYGRELALCQRYACSSFPLGTAWAQNAGTAGAFSYIVLVGGTSAGFGVSMPFPVTMRANPTLTYYNPSAANDKWRNTIINADSASGAGVNIRAWATQITNYQVAGDVASQTCQVHWSATAEL
jgi:hypothetical protein